MYIVQHSTAIYLSSIQLARAVGVVVFVIVESLNLLINWQIKFYLKKQKGREVDKKRFCFRAYFFFSRQFKTNFLPLAALDRF